MKLVLAVFVMLATLVIGMIPFGAAQAAETDLIGTQWRLVAFGDAGAEVPAVAGSQPTLEFGFDGSIGGNGSCNTYGGFYAIEDDILTFSQIFSTLMACVDEAIMGQEIAFFEALQSATTYQLTDNGQLIIGYGDGQQMIFEPLVHLANTAWELAHFVDNGIETEPLADTPLTVQFSAEGELNGSAGCNSFSGSYTLEGDALTVSELFYTEMFCEGVMDQESVYLGALGAARGVALVNGQLIIGYGRDSQLIFNPLSQLADTAWELVTFLDNEAMFSLLVNTRVTLAFDEDGNAAGSSGCNTYHSTYTASARIITFNPVVSTRTACSPDEAMTQEQSYFSALEAAIAYEVTSEQLTIYYGDGQRLVFLRAVEQ